MLELGEQHVSVLAIECLSEHAGKYESELGVSGMVGVSTLQSVITVKHLFHQYHIRHIFGEMVDTLRKWDVLVCFGLAAAHRVDQLAEVEYLGGEGRTHGHLLYN